MYTTISAGATKNPGPSRHWALPDYLEDVKTVQIVSLEQFNPPEDVLEKQITKIEATTPISSSMQGMVGTFFTSLIVGAIVAIFKRKKE